MMKSLESLVNGATHAGNHTAQHTAVISNYFYHGNHVCHADDEKSEFWLDSCGYESSRSTSRILNEYQKYYEDKGYTLLYRK